MPANVLLLIVEAIFPSDLPNFVSSCRRVYEHAGARLQKHRKNIQQYQILSFDKNLRDVACPLLDLLKTCQHDPFIGQYVTNITFMPGRGSTRQETEIFHEGIRNCNIDSLLTQCSWLPTARRQEWKTAFQEADACTIFIVLLNFLQNLRQLRLLGHLDVYRPQLAQLLSGTSRYPAPGTGPLSKVQTLHVEHWHTEGGVPLAGIGDLVFLPSLRKFTGHMIEDYPIEDSSTEPLYQGNSQFSGIEVVDLSYSAISPRRLFDFLVPMTRLSLASYEHGDTIVGGPVELDITEYAQDFEDIAQEWLQKSELGVTTIGDDTISIDKTAFETRLSEGCDRDNQGDESDHEDVTTHNTETASPPLRGLQRYLAHVRSRDHSP